MRGFWACRSIETGGTISVDYVHAKGFLYIDGDCECPAVAGSIPAIKPVRSRV